MKWAEVNEVFDEQLEPLLELVRFKSMTINYLHDVVTSDHPIASTVARFPLLFEEAVFYHAFSKVTKEFINRYSERLSCSSLVSVPKFEKIKTAKESVFVRRSGMRNFASVLCSLETRF